jgi:hypothetical protein
MKITVKQLKEAGAPDAVVSRVADLMGSQRSGLSFDSRDVSRGLYLDEDATYTVYSPEGESRTVRMDGEWNGISRGFGSNLCKTMPMPFGAWAVESQWFLGKKLVTVYHWGTVALGA